jgi:hypothetical protein
MKGLWIERGEYGLYSEGDDVAIFGLFLGDQRGVFWVQKSVGHDWMWMRNMRVLFLQIFGNQKFSVLLGVIYQNAEESQGFQMMY